MNTKELIKHYEDMSKTLHVFHVFPVVAISRVLEDLRQLDEPQKVTIPQFVADWLKENDLREETLGKQSVFDVFDSLKNDPKNGYYENVKRWIDENGDLFARAWLDGYEVEKEKRYTVKLKNTNDYLNETEVGFHFYDNCRDNGKFTQKEIEEAGFGEVFNSPLFEVEEVEG